MEADWPGGVISIAHGRGGLSVRRRWKRKTMR